MIGKEGKTVFNCIYMIFTWFKHSKQKVINLVNLALLMPSSVVITTMYSAISENKIIKITHLLFSMNTISEVCVHVSWIELVKVQFRDRTFFEKQEVIFQEEL